MKILVAGVGNIFMRDDGFGVAVARHLARCALPSDVQVTDFGIRGIHLAYELTSGGHDLTLLVDATTRGGPPGTIYVLEPSAESPPAAVVDAHALTPEAVLTLAGTFGGEAGRILIVGCEPADTSPGMELSQAVAQAVPKAADVITEIVHEQIAAAGAAIGKEERTC